MAQAVTTPEVGIKDNGSMLQRTMRGVCCTVGQLALTSLTTRLLRPIH